MWHRCGTGPWPVRPARVCFSTPLSARPGSPSRRLSVLDRGDRGGRFLDGVTARGKGSRLGRVQLVISDAQTELNQCFVEV